MQLPTLANPPIRQADVSRRSFLGATLLTSAGVTTLSWSQTMALQAEQMRQQGMACIRLWMVGGPSQFETFDPKPGTKNGGPTKAIETAASGIRIAEGWEPVAEHMKDISLVRSVTNKKEGDHARAWYQLHTGYLRSGTVLHPTLGSIAAAEIGDPEVDLPHFVHIGNRASSVIGAGFLGTAYAPFKIRNPSQPPNNTALPPGVDPARFTRRHSLLSGLEADFSEEGGAAPVRSHQILYKSAKRMMLSPHLKAFDLSREKDSIRDHYGRTDFGQGCLLARRLVEAGVTFVEVESHGWDTHADNFNNVKNLAGEVSTGFSSLLADLKERGMLEKTLIVWMGEFGRTPRINTKVGRDHHPLSFNMAFAGGGIQGGQVVGATNSEGTDVEDRPVTVPDVFCTMYRSLQIDPRKENLSPLGRPIALADHGEAIDELF